MMNLKEKKMDKSEFQKAARCIKILAHPLRLQALCLLKDGEKSVQEIMLSLNVRQSNLSQHLNLMQDRGLVTSRRIGNRVLYSITERRIIEILDLVRNTFCKID
jgi:ArsR family transcriptional regulator, virulence genes transcriptional regulator